MANITSAETKVLPRGVPQGNISQHQKVRNQKPTVIVSEYTRQVAYELDHLHSKWIFKRRYDELAELDNSIYANGNKPINHLEWLLDYAAAQDRFTAAVERRLWLQTELGNMRATRKVQGVGQHKKQFLDHYEALKRELLYVGMLQMRLRALVHAAHQRELQSSRIKKIAKIEEMLSATSGVDSAVLTLIELRAALNEWTQDIRADFSPRLKEAMRAVNAVINSEASRLGIDFIEQDMTDEEAAAEFEKMSKRLDEKRKGTPLNEKSKVDWKAA